MVPCVILTQTGGPQGLPVAGHGAVGCLQRDVKQRAVRAQVLPQPCALQVHLAPRQPHGAHVGWRRRAPTLRRSNLMLDVRLVLLRCTCGLCMAKNQTGQHCLRAAAWVQLGLLLCWLHDLAVREWRTACMPAYLDAGLFGNGLCRQFLPLPFPFRLIHRHRHCAGTFIVAELRVSSLLCFSLDFSATAGRLPSAYMRQPGCHR